MEQREEQERDGAPAEAPRDGGGGVDVQSLAERVYRLMMAEARLERARGVPTGRPRS